jgi:hypothetical protein
MDEVLAFAAAHGVEALLFVVAALVPIVGVGLVVSRPAPIILAYIGILLCFSQTTYGALEIDNTIYSRGTGQLFFSLLAWALIGLAAVSPFLALWSSKRPVPTNLAIPFLMLVLLFVGNLIFVPLDVRISEVMSSDGFINLIFLSLLVFVMTRALNERTDLDWLEWLLLGVGAMRAIYGLVRWAALGGDPSNVYENVEHLGVKITYFDICDSMIASVVLLYCLRRLFSNWRAIHGVERFLLATLAAMEFAVIALSYRRTAWGGLALVLAFFAFLLPGRQRIAAMVTAPFLGLLIMVVAQARLGQVAHGQGFIGQLFFDLYSQHDYGKESPRTVELKAAFETFLDNPVFGTGAWGRYRGSGHIGWQTGPNAYAFLHSGVLHILLKTGLVGFAIVTSALLLFIRFVIRERKTLSERDRWLVDAALAGLIFMIPDFMLGAPIPQFRTMLLYGVMMAIPYVVVATARREPPLSTQ